MILRTLALVLVLSTLFAASEAFAQARNGSIGGSSLFGSGGSSFGSGSSIGSSFGTASSGFGQGSFGNQQGFGQTGQGGQGLGFGNQAGGGNQGFVGTDASEAANFFENLNPFGGQGATGGNFSRNAMSRGREANATQDVRPPLMVKVSLGFRPPTRPRARVSAGAQTRLNGILTGRGLDNARVTVTEGVAVVSGTISSPSDRMLIERLARLEPGVDRVDMQATVAAELPIPAAPSGY